MIRSNDSEVLKKFKSSNNNYELVYLVDENIREILNSTIVEISKFANSVVISKASVFPVNKPFISKASVFPVNKPFISKASVVPILQPFRLQVYVQYFQKKFVSQPWDFYSDPYAEINTHVMYMGVQGIITDFPATATRYRSRQTSKSDVYSFGVILLELMSGRQAIDKNQATSEQKLVEWAKPYLVDQSKVVGVMDNRLEGQYTIDTMQKVASLSLLYVMILVMKMNLGGTPHVSALSC